MGTPPPEVYQSIAEKAVQRTEQDCKRKATEKSKVQGKKAKYSSAAVDNSITSRRAYTPGKQKYDIHCILTFNYRYDSGPNADDVPSHLPPNQLQDLVVNFYRSNIFINSDKMREIQSRLSKEMMRLHRLFGSVKDGYASLLLM